MMEQNKSRPEQSRNARMKAQSPTGCYFLTEHTYVRETGEQAVFLDLKRNRYMAVDADALPSLRKSVVGWPQGVTERTPDQLSGDTSEFLSTLKLLIEKGILTQDSRTGRETASTVVEPATATTMATICWVPRITWRDIYNFVRAWSFVTVIVRIVPVRWMVARLRRRKEAKRNRARDFDSLEAQRLFISYRILRPNFFDPKNACLRDSLTFIEYCAFYRLYPTLVFGVKVGPFAAHAWVQEGEIVLNDSLEHVKGFAPILAV